MRQRGLFLLALLIVTAISVAAIFFIYSRSSRSLVADAERELRATAGKAVVDVGELFSPAELIADRLQDAALPGMPPQQQQEIFFALASYALLDNPSIGAVYIGRADGSFRQLSRLQPNQYFDPQELARGDHRLLRRVLERSDSGVTDRRYYEDATTHRWEVSAQAPPGGYDPRERGWYTEAVARHGPGWTKPYAFSSGDIGITMSEPIFDDRGTLWAVIGVNFSLETLARLVYDYRLSHIGTEGFIYVSDDKGQLIGHSRLIDAEQSIKSGQRSIEEATSLVNLHLDSGDDLAVFHELAYKVNAVVSVPNGGRDILAVRLPITTGIRLPYDLYVGQSLESVTGGAIVELRRDLAILAGLILVLCLIGYYAATLRREIGIRKRIEGELQRSHTGLAQAQALGHIGSAEFDVLTGEAHWSDEQFRLYGLDPVGDVPDPERIYAMIYPEDSERMRASRERNMHGEESMPLEYRIVRPNGQLRWVHREVKILRDAAGRAIRYFSTQQDVTERKEAEEALRQAKEVAEEATRTKSSFLAMMSHEIRTPMNGVMSMAEMLDQTDLTDDQRGMSSVIRGSAAALLTIINDILDFSKIEAGRLEIEKVEFSLVETVEGAAELMASRGEEKGIALIVDLDPDLPDGLIGDPMRLRQILLNLLGNAVKFTETGSVVLRAGGRGSGEGTTRIRFEIVDSGIGMTQDQRAKLFQPFAQADSSTSRKYGGTGLGLSICHRLCTIMGGTIGVDSELGKGSTFWCEIPFATTDAAPSRPETAIADIPIAAISFVSPGREALARLLRGAGVSDIRWLDADDAVTGDTLDGRVTFARVWPGDNAALAFIRKWGGQHKIVLVAPRGLASTIAAAGNGVFATVSVPIQRRRLWHVIAAAMGRAELTQRSAGATSGAIGWVPPPLDEARAANAAVLVAEDNATNRIVIHRMLDQRGYAHEIAENGAEALERFKQGGYGLLLTDFHMPEMDGFELTVALRAIETEAGGRLPIVALTADALPGTEKRCLDAGMDDYLTKPIDSRALTAALEKYLPQALALRRTAGTRAADKSAEIAIDPEILDTARLREVFNEIDGAAITFLVGFIGDVPEMIAAVGAALQAGEKARARNAAHALKGAARSSGAVRLGQGAADIQDRLDDDDPDTAAILYEGLQETYTELKETIETMRNSLRSGR